MTFTTEKVRVPEGMTNLTCFDYMQFKFDFANLDIHLCHWVHKHQSSIPGFPGTVSSHPFQAWKWSCCQTTSLQTKIKMNLLSPFATEALWVFSILCLQTVLASCFYVCLHNCSNFLRGEIFVDSTAQRAERSMLYVTGLVVETGHTAVGMFMWLHAVLRKWCQIDHKCPRHFKEVIERSSSLKAHVRGVE